MHDPATRYPFHPEGLSFSGTHHWLQQRLQLPHSRSLRGDRLQDMADTPLTAAAVLVPLVYRPTHLSVLLTQRTEHLSKHPGQIAFPGGRAEPDDPSAEATALRESREEIGLPAGQVYLAGRLPTYITITGYQVTPVVGLLAPPFDLQLDANEVADAFEVPLSLFFDPTNYTRHQYELAGRHGSYLAVTFEQRFIWGATAAMLLSLGECLMQRSFLE